MKRALWMGLVMAGSLLWMLAQVGNSPRPLATLFPAGPALYLEAKDFQSLLKDWSVSDSKRLWLTTDNYDVFSRSNLAQKLTAAQTEFAAAAGVPPDMALLANIAGTESAIAIYDIGQLEFLYVTRMPSARVTESALWKVRGNYQPRQSSGLKYYVHADRASKRVAAFAQANGFLFLATREDVLASALALLANQTTPAMAAEAWYTQAVQAAQPQGELRLVLNMPKLLESPYMRSYWIQRNASALKQYASAISDASRGATELDENRLLFRAAEESPTWNENAVAEILKAVPSNAGLYRAWASPTTEQAFEILREKIIEPGSVPLAESRSAPEAAPLDSTVGSEADLETRIDVPPLDSGRRYVPDALRNLLDASPLDAMLYVGSTRILPDGVFAGIDSAVALSRKANWNLATVRNALTAAGAQLEGPAPLTITANADLLIIADNPLAAGSGQAGTAARYAAAYRHAREFRNFEKMFGLIDRPLKAEGPMFFSVNAASFGRSILSRLDSASIRVHDTGSVVRQSLVYKLKP